MQASFKNPLEKQALSAYDPNALRNRLPVEFEGAAKPCVRFCSERNGHTYECAARFKHTCGCEHVWSPSFTRVLVGGADTFCSRLRVHSFLKGFTEPGYKPYRTSSSNFYDYDTQMLAVGESNQGIVVSARRISALFPNSHLPNTSPV